MILTLGGMLAAGATLGSQIFANRRNRQAQLEINKQNLQHDTVMYERQRSDALADRDYADKYNSPAQQMQRYKEAGLNPNLIYGQATNTPSATVRSASQMKGTADPPRYLPIDFGAGVTSYLDNNLKQAQINQTEQVTKNLEVDNILKQLNTVNSEIRNRKGLADLTVYQDMQNELLEKLQIGNEILEGKQNFQYTEANILGQKLANMQKDGKLKDQMLENLKNQSALQQLDLLLKRYGVDGSDPLYIKSILKFLTTGSLEEATGLLKVK